MATNANAVSAALGRAGIRFRRNSFAHEGARIANSIVPGEVDITITIDGAGEAMLTAAKVKTALMNAGYTVTKDTENYRRITVTRD